MDKNERKKTVYNKLVRDRIPEIIEKSGKKANYRRITDQDEYKKCLISKLEEEVEEFKNAVKYENPDAIIEELVDIYDVLGTILRIHNIDFLVRNGRIKKQMRKGAFIKRIFLESVEG